MADIDVRRLRAIDGVAPQHKKAGEDEFEFTEGSGGALHTKDVDVLAELESIKQQQQQILHRLDEPIDTQLTGSNAEYVFLEYIELTTGSTVYTEAQDYNGSRLGVNVRFNDAIKHRVRGFLLSKQVGRGVGGVVDIIDSRDTAATQTHGSLQMTTTRVNIGITNDDDVDTQVNLVSIVDFII